MTRQPPRPTRLVAETAIQRGEAEDMIFRASEFDRFDHHLKRRLAGAAATDEISGRSTMLEIRSYFVVQRSLDEYAQE